MKKHTTKLLSVLLTLVMLLSLLPTTALAADTYTITAGSEDTNKGTVTGGGTYADGESVTLTATVKEGFRFAGWYENDGRVSSSLSYTFNATKDRTIEARFNTIITTANAQITAPVLDGHPDMNPVSSEPDKYTVTLMSWWRSGYPLQLDEDDVFEIGNEYVIRVLFTPKSGYTLDDAVFTVNGQETSRYGTNTTVREAEFVFLDSSVTYNLTVNGGTGSGSYSELEKVTVTATPPANMGFKQWNGLDDVTFVDDTNKQSATATFKMPARAVEATAVYGINNVTATATGNIKPVLGNNAETNPTFTYNFPELTTRSNSCWRYSSDGEDFEYAGYIEGTEKFCVGYWRFDLSVDLNGLSISNPCTVTVNGTKWQFVPSVRLTAESPVYYLDAEGNVSVVMFEIDGVTATCPAMPDSLSAEDTLPHLAFTPTPTQAVVRGDGTWQKKSGDNWVNVSGAAKAGNTYRYKTIMHIDSSTTTHTFTDDVTLKVNGTSWTVDYTTMQNKGTADVWATVYSPEYAAKGTTINTINIKGITAPVAGEAPVVTEITTDTAGITLGEIQWLKPGGAIMQSTDKFEAGVEYLLKIKYTVGTGYELSDTATVTSDSGHDSSNVDYVNTAVRLNYKVPVAAKYTVTVTGGGTVAGNASVTTEAGTRLQLRAPEVSGKRFIGWSGLDGVTFYGDNAKVTDPVLGFIMPAKNFTVTANYQDAVEITTVNIKGITKPLAGANPVNFGVTTDTTGLSVKEVIWYFDRTPSTNVPHNYEFQLGDKIKLLIVLDVADGYTFADPLTITANLEYTAAYRGLTYGTVYIEYTVTEEMPTTYTVTVTNGTGGGNYAEGTSVTITADTPATGKQFKAWTTEDGVTFTDTTAATTTFTMPAKAVTVTATYEDIPAAPKTLDSIAITTPPTKTAYTAGESFDSTGMVVTATYSDSSTAPVTGYTVSPSGALSESDTQITVSYTEGGVTKTATQAITVAAASGSGGTGSSGSGGVGGGVSTYAITVKDAKNGEVTSSHKSASAGTTVTLTVDADKGYALETLTVTDGRGKEVKITEKNGKYTFKMPASKVTVEATFMDDNTMLNYFVDVSADAYYYDAVLWAAEEGITSGTDAVHFSPNVTCTRAQAVTFLWRAAGSPEPKSSAMPFEDVAADAYYYDAVLWAVENGITAGTTATTFAPNATCTRAQIVTFLWRSQKSPAAESVSPFTDVAAEAYYNDAVVWAVENGVTAGTTAATFSPDNNCTRAQIVTFLYRCMEE